MDSVVSKLKQDVFELDAEKLPWRPEDLSFRLTHGNPSVTKRDEPLELLNTSASRCTRGLDANGVMRNCGILGLQRRTKHLATILSKEKNKNLCDSLRILLAAFVLYIRESWHVLRHVLLHRSIAKDMHMESVCFPISAFLNCATRRMY